jgi:hypothetical protein
MKVLTIPRIVEQSTDESSTPSKRDEIQWPALDKLTPSHLRRTMSLMIQDWEKSLTPSPEERAASIVGSGGRSRSTSPLIL